MIKRLFVFQLIGIFCLGSLSAQVDIINQNLVDDAPDILYFGTDNHLVVSGHNGRNIKLTVDGGSVSVRDEGFNVKVIKPGSVSVEVYNGNQEIIKQKFSVHRVSNPVVHLGSIKDSKASVTEILKNAFLVIRLPGCYYKHDLKVISFDLVISNRVVIKVIKGKGYIFNHDMKEAIQKLKPGNKLFFENIRVRGSDSITRIMPILEIKII